MKKWAANAAITAAIIFLAGIAVGADPPGKTSPPPAQKGKAARFDHKDNTVKSKACVDCHPKDKATGRVKTQMPAGMSR